MVKSPFPLLAIAAIIGLVFLAGAFLINSARRMRYTRWFERIKNGNHSGLESRIEEFYFVSGGRGLHKGVSGTKIDTELQKAKESRFEKNEIRLDDYCAVGANRFLLLSSRKKAARYIPGEGDYFSVTVMVYNVWLLEYSPGTKMLSIKTETIENRKEKTAAVCFSEALLGQIENS